MNRINGRMLRTVNKIKTKVSNQLKKIQSLMNKNKTLRITKTNKIKNNQLMILMIIIKIRIKILTKIVKMK